MKLALATWNGKISPVFDVARQVQLVEVDAGQVIERREATLPGTDIQSQADQLRALGTQVLICGAISRPMADLLAANGVETVPFTAGTVEHVLHAWLAGGLPATAWSMPGCRNRRRRLRCGMQGSCGQGRWTGGPQDRI